MMRKMGVFATCALLLLGGMGCDFNGEEPFEDDNGIIEENGEGEGNGDGLFEEEEEEEE
ncbi:MAG: hypothetical protein GF331_01440 [Chitinivibrionales bacterium]|nr:hypothetical protein [Chitinivibrionales bacterium]